MSHSHCCCKGGTCGTEHPHAGGHSWLHEWWKPIVSFVMVAAGIAAEFFGAELFQSGPVRLLWYVAAYMPVGIPVLIEAAESIRNRDFFSEFMLMTIATAGAFCIGEYPEAVAVMLFYTVGEMFQDMAVDSAERNISALLGERPDVAYVVRGGEVVEADPQTVMPGELTEVRPGGRVPLDGVLEDDGAAFNTAALTGESVPRMIGCGGEVLSGMIAADRVVRIRVTRPYSDSAYSRILDLVRNAASRKAPAELFIRRFARVYTPVVIVLAVLTVAVPWLYSLAVPGSGYVFAEWLYRSLVFLVISCPCALVVSIPLGYFGGIGAASRLGVLFKGGNYLDAVTHVDTVVFDKTGTLTDGTFSVSHVGVAPGMTEPELLTLMAAAESGSTHPIARALAVYAEERGCRGGQAADVVEAAGCGIVATVSGRQVCVGNMRLMKSRGIACPEELDSMGGTAVICAVDGCYAGYAVVADRLKDDAVKAIEDLKMLGISNIQILSGDRQTIVDDMVRHLGIPAGYGDLLPEGKMSHLEKLKEKSVGGVVFVGDGINDAPVLASATVGMAMGGLGSDAAVEAADVVIRNDSPSKVAVAIRAGRATRRVVRQNIILALGIKVVVMCLGAAGMASLWAAVFADVGVALIAILNAVRVQRMV